MESLASSQDHPPPLA